MHERERSGVVQHGSLDYTKRRCFNVRRIIPEVQVSMMISKSYHKAGSPLFFMRLNEGTFFYIILHWSLLSPACSY
jgi:hypothetical protein